MSSNLNFAGSIERDLTVSKVWLCQKLPKKKFKHVYVLGSWFGNMGLIMRYLDIDFGRITNVDDNKKYCAATDQIYKLAGFDRPYRNLNQDCNLIDYADADLVINTSTNDIRYHDWYANIPLNCMIAIQCRNNQTRAVNKDNPGTFKEFLSMFDMKSIMYSGKLKLSNSDETYNRYMLIGRK